MDHTSYTGQQFGEYRCVFGVRLGKRLVGGGVGGRRWVRRSGVAGELAAAPIAEDSTGGTSQVEAAVLFNKNSQFIRRED